MKRELWAKVKVGSPVIYADEYDGVHRARVVEVDIRIYSERAAVRWSNPYGLTAESGAVKIKFNETEKIENLADLVDYGPSKLARLRRDWNKWQTQKAAAEGLQAVYLARILEYRAY